jgi:hypothetical protein
MTDFVAYKKLFDKITKEEGIRMRSFITSIMCIVVLIFLLTGCGPQFANNIKSNAELKGKKVLAGRFVCFDNDTSVACKKTVFSIYFNKQGDTKAKIFNPDEEGYVYVALSEGQYNFATIAKGGTAGNFQFRLDSFPVVFVQPDDSTVNFGTIEVRFYQSIGSKVAIVVGAIGRGHIRVNHIPNYDVTRSEIDSRVGKVGGAGPTRDGKVEFLKRVTK